jgi:hypothetical protein
MMIGFLYLNFFIGVEIVQLITLRIFQRKKKSVRGIGEIVIGKDGE